MKRNAFQKLIAAIAVAASLSALLVSNRVSAQDQSLEPDFSTDDQKACLWFVVTPTMATLSCERTGTMCRTPQDCIKTR